MSSASFVAVDQRKHITSNYRQNISSTLVATASISTYTLKPTHGNVDLWPRNMVKRIICYQNVCQ